ncbi:MAG: 2-oxo acid dehydrogenase subunit E2 [Brevinematales bacterium]|jgi:hypothetical protein
MAFKKRKDGIYLKKLPAFRKIFPYLMKTRMESVVYFNQKIFTDRLTSYLEKINSGKNREEKITIFHVFLAAISRTLKLRPELNRFVSGHRIYEHTDISITFTVKKELTEQSPETNSRIVFTGYESLASIRDLVNGHLKSARGDSKTEDDKLVDIVASLPRPVINMVAWLIRFLDYHNIMPDFLMKAIPLYTTVFLANLGSIGLEAPFHHLFEYGSASIFMVIGKLHKEAVVDENNEIAAKECVNVAFTFDERVNEGFYNARSLVLFRNLVENPELLEKTEFSSEELLPLLQKQRYA